MDGWAWSLAGLILLPWPLAFFLHLRRGLMGGALTSEPAVPGPDMGTTHVPTCALAFAKICLVPCHPDILVLNGRGWIPIN
jgi:hypothetical protein